MDIPITWAKVIVANLPKHSRVTLTKTALVGEADEFPTPMPILSVSWLYYRGTSKILHGSQK